MPDRATVVAKVVTVALASCPSIATARRTIERWQGHPYDLAMRADVLALLDQMAQDGIQPELAMV